MAAHRFARLPLEILTDNRLTPADKVVYAALASNLFKGNIVAMSQKQLAVQVALSVPHVRRSLYNLGKAGAISSALLRLKRIKVYQLNSPLFIETEKFDAERKPYLVRESDRP